MRQPVGGSDVSRMDYHYETIGRVLSHLVGQGLGRVDLDPSDAFEIMAHTIGDEDEVLKTFSDVLHWMHDEGLIRTTSIQGLTDTAYAFNGVQLTSRGIAIVQAKPNDPELGESIERTVAQARGNLEASFFTKAGSFVGGLLGGFTKSISG